jgi:hypothetical protein
MFDVMPLLTERPERADVALLACRILALIICFLLLGCGTSEKPATPDSKTAASGGQSQKEQHRPECQPQPGGGILCQ